MSTTTTTYTCTSTACPIIGPATASYTGITAILGFLGLLEVLKHMLPVHLATKGLIAIPAWLFAT